MSEKDRTLHARALDLFMQALEQPTAWRDKWLAQKTADEPELGAAVERLRLADATQSQFLGQAPTLDDDRTGEQVGGWRIVDVIATGGMGRVYRVERVEGDFAQTGALKIIRFALEDTPEEIAAELLRRFQNERQILANISHPNIAAVLDGGATAEGLPFLVMEYVQGTDLVTYANTHHLDLQARLALFLALLDALGAVHRNLVVHRDLKPSNILVDERGHLKLLDFGIAKVLEAQPGMSSADTLPQASAMTPDYASPEQLLGQPITVAADIYALGLLLYRLLTGVPAYSVHSLPLVEAHELICRTDPMPPSRTLREVPNEHITPTQLVGDLDSIVMKAVRKEPAERYGSTAEMANDIQRFLAGQPVSAQADTRKYRAKKFLQRNRWVVASLGAIMFALSTGLGVALWQAERAREAAITARQEADKATAVTEFLQDVLTQADPLEANENPTVREALDAADDQIGDRFSDHPEVEAAVRRTLGWTQLSLGRVDRAAPNLQRAYEMNSRFYGERHPVTLKGLSDLAWLAFEASDYDTAVARYQTVIAAIDEDTPMMLQASAHNDFGVVLDHIGRSPEAIDHYLQAQALYQQVPGAAAAADYGAAVGNLAAAYHGTGQVDEAEKFYLRHIELSNQAIADGAQNIQGNLMYTLNNYAVLLAETGRKAEAVAPLQRAADMRADILGDTHPHTARTYMNVSRLHLDLGQPDLAAAAFEKMSQGLGELSSDDDTVIRSRILRSQLLEAQGHREEALRGISALLAELEPLQGTQFIELKAQAHLRAGHLLSQSGQRDAARQAFARAVALRLEHYGEEHFLVANARRQAAQAGFQGL